MLPATSATVVPGAPFTALDEDNGVRVAATADAWAGRPDSLPDEVTPVKVRIVNHSGRPVRILYGRFVLTGENGRKYHALPPLPLNRQKVHDAARALNPIYAMERFFIARRYQEIYTLLPAWPTTLPRDTTFYERQYSRWPGDLPTLEMRRMALPEGVLGDGGTISGFLYFENATEHESSITLNAGLEDGDDGGAVASLEIPFRVQ